MKPTEAKTIVEILEDKRRKGFTKGELRDLYKILFMTEINYDFLTGLYKLDPWRDFHYYKEKLDTLSRDTFKGEEKWVNRKPEKMQDLVGSVIENLS